MWNANCTLVSHCWLTLAPKSVTAPSRPPPSARPSPIAKTPTPLLISLSRPKEITSSIIRHHPPIKTFLWSGGDRDPESLQNSIPSNSTHDLWARVRSDSWSPVCPCCPLASVLSWAERASDKVTVTAVLYYWTFFESRSTTAPKDREDLSLACAPVCCTDLLRPSTVVRPLWRPLSHLCVIWTGLFACVCVCARPLENAFGKYFGYSLARLIYFEPIAPQVILFVLFFCHIVFDI